MCRTFLSCLLIFLNPFLAYSQSSGKADTVGVISPGIVDYDWSNLIEEILENTENQETTEKWQDILSELAENPIPINSASKELFERIPFLSESQIEALSYYIYRYGPLVNISELMLVEGMDEQTLRWLRPFVVLGKAESFPVEMPTLTKALKYGKQEIRMRFGRSLQRKKGYVKNINSSYLGDPNHLYFRYGFNYKEKMQWGLVLEKDAGEKVWYDKAKGLDYSSLHFVLKDQKRLKTLILGDYNLRFGQGLVCASTFSLGKTTAGTSLEQTGTSLIRHFSSGESGYFRGFGATFLLKPFIRHTKGTKGKFGIEMTAFGSLNKLDASIVNGYFSTTSTTGLHRTKEESDIKDKLKLQTIGTHLSLRTENALLGFTILTYGFNAKCNPEWKPYNCFYQRGKQFGDLSMDYRLRYQGMTFFGEIAMDEKKNTAMISGISIKPYSRLDLSLLVRSYAPEYNALFANAFSENTTTKNEKGYFANVEWRIIKKWRINAYYDVFTFPWLKFGVNAPSTGTDYALQATWTPSSGSQISVRFKEKTKSKNISEDENIFTSVACQLKNQIRVQISSIHGNWSLKTVLDGNTIEEGSEGSKTLGFSASQEVNYKHFGAFSCSVRYAMFDTDCFDNRIYSYEKDMPGVFSMTSFYGKGSRFSLLVKYRISKSFNLQMKVGHSFYRDRQQVGTALEQVEGNQLTDIRSMITWKF